MRAEQWNTFLFSETNRVRRTVQGVIRTTLATLDRETVLTTAELLEMLYPAAAAEQLGAVAMGRRATLAVIVRYIANRALMPECCHPSQIRGGHVWIGQGETANDNA